MLTSNTKPYMYADMYADYVCWLCLQIIYLIHFLNSQIVYQFFIYLLKSTNYKLDDPKKWMIHRNRRALGSNDSVRVLSGERSFDDTAPLYMIIPKTCKRSITTKPFWLLSNPTWSTTFLRLMTVSVHCALTLRTWSLSVSPSFPACWHLIIAMSCNS